MNMSLDPANVQVSPVVRPPDSALRRFLTTNRAAVGTLAVFVAMIAI